MAAMFDRSQRSHRPLRFLLSVPSLALLAATGCGPSETRVASGNREGVLHINNGAEVQSLDPHTITGLPEFHVIAALLEGLTSMDPEDLTPVPAAARDWDVSDDETVYTFYLREDATWSNGDPITAGDFLFGFERILSPNLASHYAYMLYPMRGAEAFHSGEIDDFSEVGARALDDHTLEITLEYPVPYFLTLVTHNTWYPVHPETILAHGAMDEPNTRWVRPGNFVGNGPFTLERWATGRRIEVRRNPDYWDAGRVHLEEVHFYPLEPQAAERAFRAEQLHLTDSIPSERIGHYLRERPDLFRSENYFGTYYFRFNVTRPPLDDARVRLALALALDRDMIVDNLFAGERPPALSFVPPGVPDYEPDPILEPDPERARELLAEAGYSDGEGFPAMRILYNTSDDHSAIAQLAQEMWRRELGIQVGLENTEWQVYLDRTSRLEYDIARSGWIGDYLDPYNFLNTMASGGGNNRTGWASDAFDDLLSRIVREGDTGRRWEMIRQAERLLVEEAPVVPLFFYTRMYLQHPAVRGWRPTPIAYRNYKDVTLVAEEEDS